MTVEFELTVRDVLAAQRYDYHDSPQVMRAQRLEKVALPVLLGLLVSAVAIGASGGEWLYYAVGAAFFAVMTLYFIVLYVMTARESLRGWVTRYGGFVSGGHTPSSFGRQLLTISAEGAVDVLEAGEIHTAWTKIRCVVGTDDHIFMPVVNAPGPYIVPRTAFPSVIEFRRFAETARTYYESATHRLACGPESPIAPNDSLARGEVIEIRNPEVGQQLEISLKIRSSSLYDQTGALPDVLERLSGKRILVLATDCPEGLKTGDRITARIQLQGFEPHGLYHATEIKIWDGFDWQW